MKKSYEKPKIYIEDFELSQNIAGACADAGNTIINNQKDAQCVLNWQGYFADNFCENGDPGDLECLDTYAETEGYFFS